MNDTTTPLNVSPCLFIGLGTNGWDMIDELRKLCFEEFGRAGLPCFRYVAIETDSKRAEDNSFLPHKPEEYERVRPIYITVPDVALAAARIDPGSGQRYVEGLAEWLDPLLVKRGDKSFTSGAGHLRQAGRLCLWENWSKNGNVGYELRTTIAELKEQRILDDADRFLRNEYLRKKGTTPPNEDLVSISPKVYILGTLCGGTCSGTFIDIAYFITELLGVKNRGGMKGIREPEVIGVFTLPNTLGMQQPDKHANVANSWAALKELDYYFQSESSYRVKFPDGHEIINRNEPFDTVYLETLGNAAGAVFNKILPLVQMCAMNLFTEVVAGIAGQKDRIRINFKAGDSGYLGRNEKGNIKAFSSFGLSAIWYPRYRIVNAISKLLGVEMCDGWLSKTNLNLSNVETDASIIWKRVLDRVRGSLIGNIDNPRCATNLEADIETEFSERLREFMSQGPDGMGTFLSNFPQKGSTYSDRMRNPEGQIYLRVANSEQGVSQDARKQLREGIEQYLKEHTLPEAIALTDILRRMIEKFNESIPASLPILSQSIQTSLASDVSGDLWTKLLGERPNAIREYKYALWAEIKHRTNIQLIAVRDHWLKSVLDHLTREVISLKDRMSSIESRISLLRTACARKADEQIELNNASNVLIISGSRTPGIREDVEMARKEILKTKDHLGLRSAFLNHNQTEIFDRLERLEMSKLLSEIDAAFSSFGQSVVSAFDIGKEAKIGLQNKIQNLVLTSVPYVEPVTTFSPMITPQSPNFIFCHDRDAGDRLSEMARTFKNGFTPSNSPLGHFIFFYQELPGLAISDLHLSGFGAELLADREDSPERICTSFLHKQGSRYFDVKAASDWSKLLTWVEVTTELVPEALKTDGRKKFIERNDGNNYDFLIVNDVAELQSFANGKGVDLIIDMLKEILENATEPVLRNRAAKLCQDATAIDEKRRLKARFDIVLDGAFSKN